MKKKIFLLGLICLVLLSACSTTKDAGYTDVAPVQIENTGSDINLPEESEIESQTEMRLNHFFRGIDVATL